MWVGVENIEELKSMDFFADEVCSIYTSDGKIFGIGALAISYLDLK